MKFEKYAISEAIKENLARLGLKDYGYPVQIHSSILKGEDVLAIAQPERETRICHSSIDKIHRQKSSKLFSASSASHGSDPGTGHADRRCFHSLANTLASILFP
jgi:hypothetical protein